jgi:6-phosphogluconate dehydrogenase
MQLIAEAYDILKRGLNLHEDEIAAIFEKWNKGVLDSFLIEITTNILKFKDNDGEPMVTKILDQAGQKGTGKWTAIAALDAGTAGNRAAWLFQLHHSNPFAVTLIGEAVFARCLSAIKQERLRASKIISGPAREFKGDKQQFIDDLEQASPTKVTIKPLAINLYLTIGTLRLQTYLLHPRLYVDEGNCQGGKFCRTDNLVVYSKVFYRWAGA